MGLFEDDPTPRAAVSWADMVHDAAALRVAESAGDEPPWEAWRSAARRASFLPGAWLEGDLPALPPRELAAAAQWQLRHAAALAARLDLALGAEVAAFRKRWRIEQLGCARQEDFAQEHLGVSWSHLAELRQIVERLNRIS